MIKTTVNVETPEGVSLSFSPAGILTRGYAYLLDFLIRKVIAVVGLMIFSRIPVLGGGLFFIFYFFLEWFYPVFFEMLQGGSTPGKRAFGLKVINNDGTPVSLKASIFRNLLRFIDFFPLLNLSAIISMLVDRKFRRLGDLAAGTMVIHVDRTTVRIPLDPERDIHPAYPPVPLSDEEKRAITDYAEKLKGLSLARQEELANILTGLTGRSGVQGVRMLRAYAAGITGSE